MEFDAYALPHIIPTEQGSYKVIQASLGQTGCLVINAKRYLHDEILKRFLHEHDIRTFEVKPLDGTINLSSLAAHGCRVHGMGYVDFFKSDGLTILELYGSSRGHEIGLDDSFTECFTPTLNALGYEVRTRD